MNPIFISYSRKDRDVAVRLHEALTAQSRDVWIDLEDIPPSARWRAEIMTAIDAADAVVVLISPDSAASPVCGEELSHAVTSHKRLVPVLVRETPADRVAEALASLNWLLMRPLDDFDAVLARLVAAVDTDLEWVRLHTRLLVRASEWDREHRDDSYLLRGADLELAQRWLSESTAKQPQPAPLHHAYLLASQQSQAREVERLKTLYDNALARQLAAQAALLMRESHALLDRATLLAVESMRRVPNAEADDVLRRSLRLRAQEVARWTQQEGTSLVEVSPDGRYLATLGDMDEVVVRTTADWKIVARGKAPSSLGTFTFVPGADTMVLVDTTTLYRFELDAGRVTRISDHGHDVRRLLALPAAAGTVLSIGDSAVLCHALDGSGIRWHLVLPPDVNAWTAAVSPNASLVAIGASDAIVRVLRAAGGKVRHELAHDTRRPVFRLERGSSDAGITGLAFITNRRLASGGVDGTMRIWDLATGMQQARGSHARDVLCLAAGHQNRRAFVATGGMDRTLRIWDGTTGEPRIVLEHQGPVNSVAWSADGRWLTSACGDGTARLWAVAVDGGAVETARCVHGTWTDGLAIAGELTSSASSDGQVIVWKRGDPDWRGRRHEYAIKKAVPSHDGRFVLAFIDEPKQILYDAADFSWRLLEHPDFVDDAWFTRDGALITTCWDGLVREFDVGTLQVRCGMAHGNRVWNAALSRDEQWIATATQGVAAASVWKRGGTQPHATLPQGQQVRCLEFSPDGRRLAVACDDGSVSAWAWGEQRRLWASAHRGIAWWAGFDPSGAVLASAGEEGALMLHDASGGDLVRTLSHDSALSECAFSPDGNWLAVVPAYTGAPLVHVWDWRRGDLVARFAHEEHVHSIDWSADSRLLATASQDRRVRVFDVPGRREHARLAYEDICITARFVPETQELLTTSYDGSLCLNVMQPGELIARALQRVPRRLTEAEWRHYLPDEPLPDADGVAHRTDGGAGLLTVAEKASSLK